MVARAIVLSACFSLSLLSGTALAQLASQTALVGTVTDTSGSVIPGAAVVAVNIGTQDTYETNTNAQGYYNIQFVRTGRYEITVTLSGFQTFKATGVEVSVNQSRARDAALQVGALAETVTVAGRPRSHHGKRHNFATTAKRRSRSSRSAVGATCGAWPAPPWRYWAGPAVLRSGPAKIQNSLSLDGINSAPIS